MKTPYPILTALCLGCCVPLSMSGQIGTAFTYQGRLNDHDAPASGLYTFRFRLVQTSNGQPQGPVLTNAAVVVSNGLFTTTLDFGSYFGSREFALEIGVISNGVNAPFMILEPSSVIRPTPLAIAANHAAIADSVLQVPDGALSVNIPRLDGPASFTGPVSFNNAIGNFTGNGAALSNIDLMLNSAGAINLHGFMLSSSPAVGNSPASVVAADVNGDGKMDLISVNQADDTFSVLTNNGSGRFTLAFSAGVGRTPTAITAADINGDGKVDLITANQTDNTLSIMTNDGSGGFVLSSSP